MYLTQLSRTDIIYFGRVNLYWALDLRDSPFDLEAFFDSDYARASLDRKSTTGGRQFLGKRLILWQCKKQTIVANSTTEAEYVAVANCCGQGTDSGSDPICQDTILGGADAQTRFKTASKQSNDPPLSIGYTLRSGEDNMKLLKLMELCTKLSDLKESLCEELTDDRSCFWKEIEVNAGNSNLMLLALVTAAGLLTTVRHNIVLSV
ncbi:hypothetical protein Tco_1403310 [Tanacetum coccineum]